MNTNWKLLIREVKCNWRTHYWFLSLFSYLYCINTVCGGPGFFLFDQLIKTANTDEFVDQWKFFKRIVKLIVKTTEIFRKWVICIENKKRMGTILIKTFHWSINLPVFAVFIHWSNKNNPRPPHTVFMTYKNGNNEKK